MQIAIDLCNAASEKLAPDREIFRIFSDFFGVPERFFMFSEVFGPVRTCLEPYGPVRTCPDAFGCLSEAFGHVLKNSKNLDFWRRFCLFSRILELRGVLLLTFFGFLRAQGCTILGVYYWEPALMDGSTYGTGG